MPRGVGWTYIIQSGNDGPIKIGSTKGSPIERLKNLQIGNPEELHLVGLLEGTSHEFALHLQFERRRIRGEWFDQSVLEDLSGVLCDLAVDAVFNGKSLVRSI